MADASTPVPPMPRREDFAAGDTGIEQFRDAYEAWLSAARDAEAAQENRAEQVLEMWRIDHIDASRAWDLAAESARDHAGLGLPVVMLPGLDSQDSCCCTNPRWRQEPRASCPSPGRHPDFGYRARAERDAPFAGALFIPDTRLVDEETAPVPGVGVVLFAGEFIEIDIDRHGTDGFETLAELERQLGPLPETLTIGTPRSGEHRIYADPRRDDPELYFRAGPVDDAPGIDLVTNGQVTPVPPTRTPNGPYTLISGTEPARLPLAWIGRLRREPPPVRVPGERREIPASSLPRLQGWIHSAVLSEDGRLGEAVRLARVTSGRNSALNLAAYRLGQIAARCELVGHPEALPEDAAYDHLMGACDTNGYIAKSGLVRAAATFRSGWNAGLLEPRSEEEIPEGIFDEAGQAEGLLIGYPAPETQMAVDFTDQSLSGRYCWVTGSTWKSFDGHTWIPAEDEELREQGRTWLLANWELAEEGVRRLCAQRAEGQDDEAEADENGDSPIDRAKEIAKAWRQANTVSKANAITTFARGILLQDITDFDADPDILNCANGIVDLRTGAIAPHDPAARMTKNTRTRYVPGATHPDWEKLLEAVPADVREWVRERFGQAITGHMTSDDKVIFPVGGGENGKTTLVTAVARAIGDYYVTVPHRALLANPDAHPTELMVFKGARLAVLEELPEDRRIAMVRIKMLAGTSKIDSRLMRKDNVSFSASHSLFVNTNHQPTVPEADHGTWRRLALLQFPYTFVGDPGKRNERKSDPGLRERMRDGGEGRSEAVLAWLIEGARRWYANDRKMSALPQRILDDTRRWMEESNVLYTFVTEKMTFDSSSHVMSADLLTSFNDFLVSSAMSKWSSQLLTQRLKDFASALGQPVDKDFHNVGRSHSHGALSRPAGMRSVVPDSSYRCWTGLAFADSGASAIA